jgi:hypothetical protein
MDTYYAPSHVRHVFEDVISKLDRARTDDKRLRLLKQADDLLRQNLYGWDAVKLRPERSYRLRPRRTQAVPLPANIDALPLPVVAPVTTAVIPVTDQEAARMSMSYRINASMRQALREQMRAHPAYQSQLALIGKPIQTWNKDDMILVALRMGLDLVGMFRTSQGRDPVTGLAPGVLPPTPLEEAIERATRPDPFAPAPAPAVYVTNVDEGQAHEIIMEDQNPESREAKWHMYRLVKWFEAAQEHGGLPEGDLTRDEYLWCRHKWEQAAPLTDREYMRVIGWFLDDDRHVLQHGIRVWESFPVARLNKPNGPAN